MKVYSYSEARQQLAELLNRAAREGEVEIQRRDGQAFLLRPTARPGSPLDVPGIDAGLSRREVLGLVRESRRSTARLLSIPAKQQKTLPSGRRSQRRQSSALRPA
jgi:antitoxin (DNA-binding transcriptional repressor) of toxin-antitoxin stability system